MRTGRFLKPKNEFIYVWKNVEIRPMTDIYAKE